MRFLVAWHTKKGTNAATATEAFDRSMALAFKGPLKGSSTYNKQLSLRFIGGDAAIVVSESGILFAGETEVPDPRKVNATWVFEKRDGQWLIAAYHNSPVLTPGQ